MLAIEITSLRQGQSTLSPPELRNVGNPNDGYHGYAELSYHNASNKRGHNTKLPPGIDPVSSTREEQDGQRRDDAVNTKSSNCPERAGNDETAYQTQDHGGRL